MTAWWNLTKKELRLGLPAFLMPFVAFVVIAGLASYFGSRSGFGWESLLGVAAVFLSFQVFYLVYYLLYSLQSERKKLHLWLHNPMPGYALILGKFTAGLISMLITMSFLVIILLLSLNLSPNIELPFSFWEIADLGVFAGIHVFLFAIDLAVWFVFFWMIFLLINRTLGTFLSVISTFLIFVISTSIYGWFSASQFYKTITNWGEVNLSGLTSMGMNLTGNLEANEMEMMYETGTFSIFLGTYIFEALVTILLFYIACWILDRKVEV